MEEVDKLAHNYPKVAAAISAHSALVQAGVNTAEIRKLSDAYIKAQAEHFGMTNVGSASGLMNDSDPAAGPSNSSQLPLGSAASASRSQRKQLRSPLETEATVNRRH